MKIHEYQSKEILRSYGISTPRGVVARKPEEALEAARELGGEGWVVKAQIHAGGRGKGGGIKLASSPEEVGRHAETLLGSNLVTPQTGPQGTPVNLVLIEEQVPIQMELYAGAVVDRSEGRVVLLASSQGGMEIEEVAREHPESLHREIIEPGGTLRPFQARRLTFAMGLPKEAMKEVQGMLGNLCRVFQGEDCSLAEINPLVITEQGAALALDAKLNLEDNAAFRHPSWKDLRDFHEEEPLEREASEYGLSYIKLDGNIGCMVNGAGLAMATMDMIKGVGGEPANFLDVGGGASEETVSRAFRILLSDPNVKVVLINIFGGIMRCDVIANGVVKAASDLELKVPLVVRLEGTNVQQGREILESSGLSLTVAKGMREAAELAVESGRH
jgi:succinyl-CoA synthetase beta subunit